MTRWVKCVPIKVNTLAWKIMSDALPTRINISRRGMIFNPFLAPYVITNILHQLEETLIVDLGNILALERRDAEMIRNLMKIDKKLAHGYLRRRCLMKIKDLKKWKKTEYPKYLREKYLGFKKPRTSESTSDSTHIGLDLNDEAPDSGDEKIEESRPMGRDKTKRMGSSVAADTDLEASSEYLRIKERELEMQDQRRREEAELERLKLAQAKKFEEQRLAQRDRELSSIGYACGKANVVADALSRKERVKPRRVRAMAMTIQSGIRGTILAAQGETFKKENVLAEKLHSLDQQMERREYGILYFLDHIWVPLVGGVRTIIMDETHKTRSPVLWAEIGESSLIGPELVQETIDKVVLIKEKLKEARDRQKSYAANRRKPLEFEVRDIVLLKVSPWYGVCMDKADVMVYMLESHRSGLNVFLILNEMLDEEGNTFLYVLNTRALVYSVIKNSGTCLFKSKEALAGKEERELGFHLVQFTGVIERACAALVPNVVCEYLCDLSKLFNSYYRKVRPGKMAILGLSKATKLVMDKCFDLLGINPAPPSLLGKILSSFVRDGPCREISEARNEYLNSRFEVFSMSVSVPHSTLDECDIFGTVSVIDTYGTRADGWTMSDKKDCCFVSYFNREWHEPLSTFNGSCIPFGDPSCRHSVPVSSSIEFRVLIHASSKNKDQYYKICYCKHVQNLSKFWNGVPKGECGTLNFESDDGLVLLNYVILKEAVDASMELMFSSSSDVPLQVCGSIMAYYGDGVVKDDGGIIGQHKAVIFRTKKSELIGKQVPLQLHKSALAVPANGCLKIEAYLKDVKSKKVIVDETMWLGAKCKTSSYRDKNGRGDDVKQFCKLDALSRNLLRGSEKFYQANDYVKTRYRRFYELFPRVMACRGLSLVSSPLHAMKSQSQIQSSAAVNLGVFISDDSLRRYAFFASESCVVELLSASDSNWAGNGDDGWKMLAFEGGVDISKRRSGSGSFHTFRSCGCLNRSRLNSS
ncbi:putative reverse transcriptase domain-containing protein [Tanacetum coccineum]